MVLFIGHQQTAMDDDSSLIQGDGSFYENDTTTESVYESDCSNITQLWNRHYELLDHLSWWFEGVGLVSVACYGILLNCVAIIILRTKKLANFFNSLLVWLSIFDALFLLFSMLYHIAVFESDILSYYWTTTIFVYIISPFRSMVMLCSIYMTVALSYDRYTAVSNPTEYKISERMNASGLCGSISRMIKYVGGIIVFSIVYYLPKFFDLEIKERRVNCEAETQQAKLTTLNISDCGTLTYYIIGTDLRNNDKFVLWYVNIANFIVTVAIPLMSLIYLNLKIYAKVKVFIRRQPSSTAARQSNAARERSKDIQQAYQLFGIVLLFVLCHLLRVSLNVEEFINMNKNTQSNNEVSNCKPPPRMWSRAILPPISHFLLQFNSSTNFFVYCFFNKIFRLILKEKCIEFFNFCCAPILPYFATNDATIENNDANANNAANTHKDNKSSNAVTNVPDSRSGHLLNKTDTRSTTLYNQDTGVEMKSMGDKRKDVEDGRV